MGSQTTTVLYIVALAAVVAVDVVFSQNRSWERLTVNIGIVVLVFAAFCFRFLKRP